jgi:hypothetical protein
MKPTGRFFMKYTIASLVCLLLTAAPLFAQLAGEPIYLTLRPAELPQPSLKYRLFPDPSQLTDGNAPTQYYRALSLFVENSALLRELRSEYWDDWLNTPLKDLPRKEVAEKVQMTRHLLRELEIGSKRKQCDWQLTGRSEGVNLLLPDVQFSRAVARPLAVRARLYIAEGKYTEACETLQIGYAFAHHLCRGPTLIHVLVGNAIAYFMTRQVETLLQQPDAPNLYWSLTVMPRPFADLKPAIHEETLWMENMFPWLKKLDAAPLSEAQVKAAEESLEDALKQYNLSAPTVAERLARAAMLAQATAEGKRELVTRYKLSNEQVAAMPSFQVAALYSFRDYKEAVEEIAKWAYVPEGWKYPEYQTTEQRYSKAVNRIDQLCCRRLFNGPSNGQFPLEKVSLSAARVDRRLAALRCVEALRQYAAKHEGKWPATLADVKDLPVPNDPLTGKPFEYAVNGDKATLALAKLAEKKPLPNQVLTYYLTMKRGKE